MHNGGSEERETAGWAGETRSPRSHAAPLSLESRGIEAENAAFERQGVGDTGRSGAYALRPTPHEKAAASFVLAAASRSLGFERAYSSRASAISSVISMTW